MCLSIATREGRAPGKDVGLTSTCRRLQWRKEEKAGVQHPPLSAPLAYQPPPLPPPPRAAPPPSAQQQVAIAPPRPAAPVPTDLCGKGVLPIKGNINSKGTKIYHLPGGRGPRGGGLVCSLRAVAGVSRTCCAALPAIPLVWPHGLRWALLRKGAGGAGEGRVVLLLRGGRGQGGLPRRGQRRFVIPLIIGITIIPCTRTGLLRQGAAACALRFAAREGSPPSSMRANVMSSSAIP